MDDWEYQYCMYDGEDSDGTHWTDWIPCSKEYAKGISPDHIFIRVRSIYNGYKND